MSDWTQRLQRLQADLPPKELESIEHLTLEMLKAETVKFGKAHQGKTYEMVWETAPDWIRWFLQHYDKSGDTEHRKVIKFIKMKIQEAEGSGTHQMPMMPKAKATPKSLAATAKIRPAPQPEMMHQQETMDTVTEPWIETEGSSQMMQMEQRMVNLENALHQILVHLTPAATPANPSTAMPAELSVASTVSNYDWETDIWNNPEIQ
eukprot:s2013_g6.t1